MTSSKPIIKVIIAIDFGTARSGFAYAFADTPKKDNKAVLYTEWPSRPAQYPKTATYLLYSPTKHVEEWGYAARARLAELRDDQQAEGHFFFSYFKMALHEKQKKTWDEQPLIVRGDQHFITQRGQEFSVMNLIVDYLRKLKEFAFEKVNSTVSGILNEKEVFWCLTVPAIWTNLDKQLMRKAAESAGLVKPGEDSERLLLALEPEVAAIYCEREEQLSSSQLRPGTHFMVVDAGGGTVDITLHKVSTSSKNSDRFTLEEVVSGTGEACGSIYVDRNFRNYLIDKLSKEVIQQFHDRHPSAYLEMLEDWERKKCNFDPGRQRGVNILLSTTLTQLIQKISPEVIESLKKEQGGRIDILKIDYTTIRSFFDPAIEGVITMIREQFSKLRGRQCHFLFLVGGFSSSIYLQQCIEKEFGTRTKIIHPSEPGAAVIAGAVQFGLDPETIRIRRARLTYGCEVSEPFDHSQDPEQKKFYSDIEGKYMCKERFHRFVQIGEGVDVGQETPMNGFGSLEKGQPSMRFSFYSTPKSTVRYIDSNDATKIGELTVQRASSGNDKWFVDMTLYFGKTEIKVEARERGSSSQPVTAILNFLPTYSNEFH